MPKNVSTQFSSTYNISQGSKFPSKYWRLHGDDLEYLIVDSPTSGT